MQTKKVIALGCGIVALLGVVGVAGIFAFLAYVVQDVEGVNVEVGGPSEVVVGQPFDLTIRVTNIRERKILNLSDIDIADEYLTAFSVMRVEPAFKSTMHVPLDNSQSFTFDQRIPAGDTREFVFTLKAHAPGFFRGDVDVCEGLRFVTDMVQTVVVERDAQSSE